ncbi:MAG: PASTA domain-containing protein [bacterium]|nr:PASTA domain-containing protein [bacterium]
MAETDNIIMPNLLGTNLFHIPLFLEGAGLQLGKVIYEDSDYGNNIIIHQNIRPGAEVKSGKKIDLKVSGTNPIRFLPSIIQSSDIRNNDMLRRFLWIFQSVLNSINIKLDHIDTYFNPLEAPKEFFQWLASWFAISLDYAIPEEKMRLLVKEAVNLYRWRGTAIGIAKFLEIITGVMPKVIQNEVPYHEYVIKDDLLVERPIIGENTSLYNFIVEFPVKSDHFDLETMKKIHQILKSEKPAHSNYFVVFHPEEGEEQRDHSLIGLEEIK